MMLKINYSDLRKVYFYPYIDIFIRRMAYNHNTKKIPVGYYE
jgi:hypothetical protein